MTTAEAVRERPILFSGPMVRAILDGAKTQTRRIVKQTAPPNAESVGMMLTSNREAREHGMCWWLDSKDLMEAGTIGDEFFCPYGVPADRLWVRETWMPTGLCAMSRPSLTRGCGRFLYAADDAVELEARYRHMKWRPSIHMPRWASRITLEITQVYAVRLTEISCYDIRGEGVRCPEHDFPGGFCCSECPSLRRAFAELWDSINGKRAPWSSNPWVWAISFERCGV